MIDDGQAHRTQGERLTQIDRALRRAGDAVGGHPHQGALRTALDGLRRRLGRIHVACDRVEAGAWADYVARLDRGLDELVVEIDRAGAPGGPDVDEPLFVHATRLEIDGWRLRLDHARDDLVSAPTAHELTARAARELDAYRRGEAGRGDVERVMDEVRDTAAA